MATVSAPAVAPTGVSPQSSEHLEHQHTRAGLTNEGFGMILFILSEAIMFGAFFAQYFYARLNSTQWPPLVGEREITRVPALPLAFLFPNVDLPSQFREALPLALVLTIVLTLSGFTAHFAQTAMRRDQREAVVAWLAITVLLGLTFLAGQAYEYAGLVFGEGLTPSSTIYGSTFYALTGLHGLHVTGGVLSLTVVLVRVLRGHFTPRNHFGFEGTILYWHFVDVVWFALYATVYLF